MSRVQFEADSTAVQEKSKLAFSCRLYDKFSAGKKIPVRLWLLQCGQGEASLFIKQHSYIENYQYFIVLKTTL